MTKEQKFYNILQDLFVGAKLEGDSGYVNLMNIKTDYFNKIKERIKEEVKARFDGDQPEDLFDKLYTFFDSYFSDGGAIFFSSTPVYKNIYAKVYSDREDTTLFWKTAKLYYVKSEANYKSIRNLSINSDPEIAFDFDFDTSLLKHKKANEKKELEFYFIGTRKRGSKKIIKFRVLYKNDNKYTKLREILKIKDKGKIIKYLLENIEKIKNPKIILQNSGLDFAKLNDKKAKDKIKIEFIVSDNKDLYKSVSIEPAISEIGEIEKYLKLKGVTLNSEEIKKAFKIYKKQTEIDYFIHKDAKGFLREQFDLYMYQHLTNSMETIFNQESLSRIKKVKEIAYLTIDFIGNFEDELKKIWLKPKFVRNSNYVISLKTLEYLLDKNNYKKIVQLFLKNLKKNEDYRNDLIETLREVYKHPLQKIYVKDIKIDKEFTLNYVKYFDTAEKRKKFLKTHPCESKVNDIILDRGKPLTGFAITFTAERLQSKINLEKSYIDTKYFGKDFVIELLTLISEKNCIDDLLDGYLIKSDNFHFLNSANKFLNNIKLIYIDPPFNTEDSGYAYIDKFKDSTWLSFLENRVDLSKKYLAGDGSFYIHLDHNCNYLGRFLLNSIFDTDPRREIIWNTGKALSGFKTKAENWIRQHDTIYYYPLEQKPLFNKIWVKNDDKKINGLGWLDIFKDNKENKLFIKKYKADTNNPTRRLERVFLPEVKLKAIGDIWNDIYSLMYTQNMTRENWGKDNTQKPENLIRRIIQSSTKEKDFVFDFFAGSGTTLVAAHKLNRRWIGVEMGDFIDSIVLKRMKSVVFGDIRPKLSEDINWQGGGFFKYYELEQYEDTLKKSVYNSTKDKLENIDFSLSEKEAKEGLEINLKKETARFVFEKLYPDVDIAETISNLYGEKIIKITKDKIILEKREIDINDLDFKKYEPLKKLIYW